VNLIVLHGPAAAGKLTTARALEALVGYPVFHNHLVVDTLTTVFPFGSAPFIELRERFWLDVVAAAAADDRSLIFTFAPEPTVPAGFPYRLRQAVEQAGGRAHFVGLTVGEAEQEARLVRPDRRAFHKLTDVATLRSLRVAPGSGGERPPNDLEIDTETNCAETSARLIVTAFDLVPEEPAPRYPR
jgi:hypothetical protein